MLAHHLYPKDSPESNAMRSAFTYSGIMIVFMVALLAFDHVIHNGFETSTVSPNSAYAVAVKTAFTQPKPLGSIFKSHPQV
jgi:formate/nitrite transporter FocA (FNT family)